MLTIKQARQIDPNLNDLSDTQLQEVLAELYELGHLALESWQASKTPGSKIPFGLLPKLKPKDTI
ncbi:MAG: hypothetical protein U1C57_02825 [Candidatus Doudnabacteria bacterium]|nr:hypothetical protein [bacterium]MDZ4244016.1 hypothetical protein [Candidatus Doudnabacteria bacterium]